MSSASYTPAVSSTLPTDPSDTLAHVPTQMNERDRESAVDSQSDDPDQFDHPPVTAPLILPQRNSWYGDLPHHTRAQLQQGRIRKPAQSLESDAKRLRLNDGKPAILMLSHDVSFGSECCKPVTVLKPCDDSGERACVFLTRRAAQKCSTTSSRNHSRDVWTL